MMIDIANLPAHASHGWRRSRTRQWRKGDLCRGGRYLYQRYGHRRHRRYKRHRTARQPGASTKPCSSSPDSATATVTTPDLTYSESRLVADRDGGRRPRRACRGVGHRRPDYDPRQATPLNDACRQGHLRGHRGREVHPQDPSTRSTAGTSNADATLVADWDAKAMPQELLQAPSAASCRMASRSAVAGRVELGAVATGDADNLTFDPMMGATITDDRTVLEEVTENGALGTFGSQKTMGTWNAAFVDDSRNDDMPGSVTGTFHVGQASFIRSTWSVRSPRRTRKQTLPEQLTSHLASLSFPAGLARGRRGFL